MFTCEVSWGNWLLGSIRSLSPPASVEWMRKMLEKNSIDR